MKHDIVYILKEDIKADELKYSLRSVCKNFEYNTIWFYGGCPDGIVPDHWVPFKQIGFTKYEKTRSMFDAIFRNEEITPDFYLFNDDFYILQPYNQDTPICNGTIQHLISQIEKRHGKVTAYTRMLRNTIDALQLKGLDTISYATHTPLLVNREKALEVIYTFDTSRSFRCCYGNYCKIGGILKPDCKIFSNTRTPDPSMKLLSTSDASFREGEVGKFIQSTFTEPCKYEKESIS